MGRRGCDGATRVNELLWRRETTPDVDDNRRECDDIDRASWSLVGTTREGMSRHLATPFRRGRRKVDLRRRPARAEESGQATTGVRGVARNKLLLKNVHATRYATAVEHSDTFGASNLERMEHIPERSRAALRGNEDL